MYSRKQLIAKLCYVYENMAREGAIGDLILSVDRDIYNSKETSKKCASFVTNVLSKKFSKGLRVITRSQGNRMHVHCAVLLPEGCDNFNWRAFDNAERWFNLYKLTKDRDCLTHYKAFIKQYRESMPAGFLELHNYVRTKARAYGFGHVKLLPVRRNANAYKYYLVGNIPRDRQTRDRGVHYFSCWGTTAPSHFKVLSRGYNNYRLKLKKFCEGLGLTEDNHRDLLTTMLGSGWHWKCREMIKAIDNLGTLEMQYEDLKTSLRQHLLRSDQL